MVKRKARTILSVADGAGGMMEVKDRRFEGGDWPIKFEIPAEQEQADRWSRYLAWECHRRGRSRSGLGQLERAENSGTITIISGGKPELEIVWERKRDRPLKVKARIAPSSTLSVSEAWQFFSEVNNNCSAAVTAPLYARGYLEYEGMAWRGELWLDDKTRLGPPSLQDESGTTGPRIVHMDAIVDCVGEPDIIYTRQQMLLEVSAFLSVVIRKAVRLPGCGRAWVFKSDDMKGCEVRSLGYLEPANPLSMPNSGAMRPVPLYALDNRPRGIDGSTNEISVREDTAELWKLYCSLGAEQRLQFLQAAAKWQEAMIHWQDRPSLSFALMAVSCEALKPSGSTQRQNCYDVIEALLGKGAVGRIRQNPFPAQHVRSTHLHSGEFHGSEFIMMNFMSTYDDPSFREAIQEMARVTPDAIIEWLKRRGTFPMPPLKTGRTFGRWLRDNVTAACGVMLALGLATGW
jgi:hypothetical protein